MSGVKIRVDESLGYCLFQGQQLSKLYKSNQRKLREAIQLRNKNLVEHLIENGTRVNDYSSRYSYSTPLHLAVISRSSEIIKVLLDAGADMNVTSRSGDTPLTLAAKIGDSQILDLLLSYNVQDTGDYHNNLTHLHIACMGNKTGIVQKLLLMSPQRDIDSAVSENLMCWAGYTPLHFAVQYGCIETVQLLLNCGAEITSAAANRMTPLHLADFQRNNEIIDVILASHKYVLTNPMNIQGLSHFHIACTRNNPSIVEQFLKLGVDVNQPVSFGPWSGWRPIHFAIYYECPKVVELLLNTKAHLEGYPMRSLLKFLLRIDDSEIYDLISARRKKSYDTLKDFRELSDFHHACVQNDTECIEKLLSDGKLTAVSDFNAHIWNGYTSAHLAVRCKSASVVKLLLHKGADFLVQNDEGKTPLHIAFEHRLYGILDDIIDNLRGHIQNLTDNTGLSVFHILCSRTKVDAIQKFLSQKMDINAQVGVGSVLWAGFTPMHFATKFLQYDVASRLIELGANISIRSMLNSDPFDLLIEKLNEHSSHPQIDDRISTTLLYFFSLSKTVEKSGTRAIGPLHALCFGNCPNVSVLNRYLTKYKDDINAVTNLPNSCESNRCTPLHLAMQRHHFDLANLLLEEGADPQMVNDNGQTPLECAASRLEFSRQASGAESIFSLQTSIKIFKPSHFHLACVAGVTNVVRRLLDKASDEKRMQFVNSRNDDGETPLHSVIIRSFHKNPVNQITHILLENGSDVNAVDVSFQTPLHWAVIRQNLDVILTLISYGANVNAQNFYGQTPLHLIFKSFEQNNKDKLVLLLENGADINIVNEQGRTCLMEKFRQRHGESEINNEYLSNMKDCSVALLQHVDKLRVIGFHITTVNEVAYAELLRNFSQSFDQAAFIDKCQKELELMITTIIDSHTTLHDILFKNSKKMVSISDNVVLQTLVNTPGFFERFLIYGYLISLQLKNGKLRGPLLEESADSFTVLSKKSLPPSCLEMILQHLTNTDLKSIILSAETSKESPNRMK